MNVPAGNGDVNCDGEINISDPVYLLNNLFLGGPRPCSCQCAVAPVCGNGRVEGGEECDDGNVADNDGCSSQCRIEGFCGDGVRGPGEQCDGADLGGLTCADFGFAGGNLACRADCQIDLSGCFGVCGDGVVEPGEECDDGNTVNGDGCSSQCRLEGICGDGIVSGSEECDDGNTVNGDGCSAICQREAVCGDGILTSPEECDDGNLADNDGCSSQCRRE